jgi:hypothetical protein
MLMMTLPGIAFCGGMVRRVLNVMASVVAVVRGGHLLRSAGYSIAFTPAVAHALLGGTDRLVGLDYVKDAQ